MSEQMFKAISNLIKRLKLNPRLNEFDEAATKQAVILPILQILDWDTANIEEVYPEYAVEKKRVDYALRLRGRPEFFLEVKKPGEDLEIHEEQLLDYSFRQGVRLAGLTNGLTWLFYLPLKEGSWAERRFYAIDIIAQGIEDAAQKFIEIMARQNVESSEAHRIAEDIHISARRHRTFAEKLPEAWNKIIADLDPVLLELVADTTEKLCGLKPTTEDVSNFLIVQRSSLTLSHRPEPPLLSRRPRIVSRETTRAPIESGLISSDTAVHLKVSQQEALEKLMTISHHTFQDALKSNWQSDTNGRVNAQSVCWLFCWAKTGMKSEETAIASQRIFNEILDISYEEFDKRVDHRWARKARKRPGNIEQELTGFLGARLES